MTSLDRHRVTWTGFPGAPGISTFYCTAGYALNGPLQSFFTPIMATLPPDVHIQVEPSGDTIESTTGALVGDWVDTGEAPLTGSGGGDYSAVSGALIRWTSDTFLSGRRLRGHTFLVPISGPSYGSDGAIGAAIVSGLTTAADNIATGTGNNLILWQRPRRAAAAYTDRRGVIHPAITARGGGYGPVIHGLCRPLVTELRSRRD